MKKYCKNIDITDRTLISKSVRECLLGGRNGNTKLSRRDTLKMFSQYSGLPYKFLLKISKDKQYKMFDGIIETIVDGIRQEIIHENYSWKPIWHSTRKENGKIRNIGIQDIKQQLYDYIAVNGLADLLHKKIGYYQCATMPNKGQVFGMRAIKRWLRNKGMRYVWKCDVSKYYESVDTERLKCLLEQYVKNKMLLKLVYALIDSFGKGLSIGSYLSQYLANYYMSFAYHYAGERLYKIRNCKDGNHKRINLISHVLIYMDDILMIGKSKKDMKMASKRFREWMNDFLNVRLKEDEWIDLRTGYIDMMGFFISRKKVIARSRIFKRYRRDINKVRKTKSITMRQALRLISRDGWIKNSNCNHWKKKNKADQIIKICKEVIRHEKNAIRIATTNGEYCIAS